MKHYENPYAVCLPHLAPARSQLPAPSAQRATDNLHKTTFQRGVSRTRTSAASAQGCTRCVGFQGQRGPHPRAALAVLWDKKASKNKK